MLLRGISSDPYEGALEEDLRRDILRELYAEQIFMMSLGACPKQGPTPSTELNISIHHELPSANFATLELFLAPRSSIVARIN